MSKISITVEADSPDELRKRLYDLSGHALAGAPPVTIMASQVEVPGTDPDRFVQQVAQEAKAKAPKVTKPKETKPDPEPEPATSEAEPEVTKAKPTKATKPNGANGHKADAVAEQAATPAATPVGLPDNIKNTNSMRDLLTYLAENGVDSAEAMEATCEALKKEVPILSKVPNVKDRVKRALDVLALFPTATPEETATA